MFEFLRRKPPSFKRSDPDLAVRAFWFAVHVLDRALQLRIKEATLTSEVLLWECGYQDRDRASKDFRELLAYSVSFSLQALEKRINTAHAQTPERFEIFDAYRIYISLAFDRVLDLPKREGSISAFFEMTHAYLDCEDLDDDTLFDAEGCFLPEFAFVRRVAAVTEIVDRDRCIERLLPYRDIAVHLVDPAFLSRKSRRRLVRETRTYPKTISRSKRTTALC